MIGVVLGALVGFASATESPGIATAQRLVAAIYGQADFQNADFATVPDEADKAALRRFATCKVANITHTMVDSRKRPDVFVINYSEVLVRFDCKHVPRDTPVGITLHLQTGKIASIETHNADLMRDK